MKHGNEGIKITDVRVITDRILRHGKLEIALSVPGFKGNPFVSEEIGLDAEFLSPSGKKLTMPGFWYQDFLRELKPLDEAARLGEQRGISGLASDNEKEPQGMEVLTPRGEPEWRIRFAPTEAGAWKYRILLKIKGELVDSAEGSFTAEESDSPGFVRIEPSCKRHFMFDNGELYIPIGENVCWWTSPTRKAYDYDVWFGELSKHGGNFARLWMATWGFGLVWSETPVDDYTNRLDRAYLLDKVVELAEEKGIYLMLCILNHGQFSAKTNPEWEHNPFNMKNGGYLNHPSEFFTNELAIKHFKDRLRYIVARWGYSTHIMSWELWNEVNWTDGYDGKVVNDWHSKMALYLKELDPYKHLVSSSSALLEDPVQEVAELDFINLHAYGLGNWCLDIPKHQKRQIKLYDKPVLFCEMGVDWRGGTSTRKMDPEGIHIHQGLWAGVMGNGAGTGMTWWWDSYIHPANLYYHFKPIRIFVDRILKAGSVPAEIPEEGWKLSDEGAGLYGYQCGDEFFLWVFDKDYTHKTEQPRLFQDVTLELAATDGPFEISWFDTWNGEIMQKETLMASGGRLSVKMPAWNRDLAAIVKRTD